MTTGATGPSRVSGLASGFDTQSIVDSLMSLEKLPFQKLEIKKETEDVKLQAYQAVNTYLLKLRTSLNSLSSSKLWNSNASVSTNDKSITANANEYAVKGTYNFRVAQLASAGQYLTKGFSSKSAPLVKEINPDNLLKPIGSINLASAKTRVDNSAKLDTLNGNKGVFRGSVRLTDAAGNSSIIDLSACDTLDDVAQTLNASTGAQVTSYLDEKGRLVVEDASNGAGSIRVQNVGAGTTATDLGIAGTSGADTGRNGNKALVGENVYTLGNDMSLSMLNDGLGIEGGNIQFTIGDDSLNGRSFYVNTNDCETVGDLIKRVNDALDAERAADDSQQPLKNSQFENLRFGLSEDKTGFALLGTESNMIYQIGDRDGSENMAGKASPATELGLMGTYYPGQNGQPSDGQSIEFGRVLGNANSPMLKSLTGVTGDGIGAVSKSDPSSTTGKVEVPFNGNTLLSSLNRGTGLNTATKFSITTWEGGIENGRKVTHDNIINNADLQEEMKQGRITTVDDLLTYMNDKLTDYANNPANNAAGLKGMSFQYDAATGAIAIKGVQSGYNYEIDGSVAMSIGLTRLDSRGTLSGIDPEGYPTEDGPIQDALDDFYGVGASSLFEYGDNRTFDDDPALGDLLNIAGLDRDAYISTATGGLDEEGYTSGIALSDYTDIPSGQTAQEQYDDAIQAAKDQYAADKQSGIDSWKADSTAAINTMFSTPGASFDLGYDRGDGTMETVNVTWDSVATVLGGGTPAAIDATTNAKDLMDAMNTAISDAFAAANGGTGAVDVNGDPISAPQIAVNKLANGFSWSGVDMSREWSMSGVGLSGMNLAKDTTAISAANGGEMALPQLDVAQGMAPPMVQGYYVFEDLETTTPLSHLNAETGLTLRPGEEIVIGLGDKGSITLKVDDIYTELGIDPSTNPNFLNDLNALTVGDYMAALNNVADTELAALNTSLGLTGTDAVELDFTLSENGLNLGNLTNIDKISVSGSAVTGVAGALPIYHSGIGGIAERDVAAGDTINLSTLIPVSHEESPITGLGQIAFSIGSGGKVIRLDTDGLNENSTLNELIDKLNKELDEIANDPAAAAAYGYDQADIDALKNVRFTVNTNGTGLAVDNGTKKAITFHDTLDANGNSDNQYIGQDLGLVNTDGTSKRVEAQSFDNMSSLNRQIVSRATDLKSLLGESHTLGSIRLTDASGFTQTVGLQECETVGDILDAINNFQGTGLGMRAQINAKGDGIEIIEEWKDGFRPPAEDITGVPKIEDMENGSTARKLGLTKSAVRDEYGNATIDGSTSVNIDVMPDDTLESLMNRIAKSGNYTTSIINKGTASAPDYRLSIMSKTTGEETDFVLSSDVEALGFNQVSRGKDAKVLYGDPSSNSSPILMSSSTNSNSTAILGLTLDLKGTSNEWASITVSTDKEKVTEEIKNMVTSYNDLVGLIMQLDGYDAETGEKGILFGDTNIRSMMDTINEFFYQVYNPENLAYGQTNSEGEQGIWSWMDAGITLSSRNSNSDGSGSWFTTLELDEEALQNMVSEKWDILSTMMASEQNVADPNRPNSSRPMASFNGNLTGDADGAINGDTSKVASNGITAVDTIENGSDTYTLMFQQPVTINRMTIYHQSADTALRAFVVEYMDPDTGEWEILRESKDNTTDMNSYGFNADPKTASAIRIRATSTNAEDGKFRLLDVQIFEQSGLASKLNQSVNQLSDTTGGFLAGRTEEHTSTLADIQEQMDRMQDLLTAKEEALWRKFTAMETALGKLQNQGSYLNNMLGSAK